LVRRRAVFGPPFFYPFREKTCYIEQANKPGESGQGKGEKATMKRLHPGQRATEARREGLGVAWGLVNGIIFTLGLWCALTGLVLLLLR